VYGRTFQEGLAQAHIQARNMTDGMIAPAMGWLAWCEICRRGFDPSSWHCFLSSALFCWQILSADFFLTEDFISRFLL
jgi:hypothetical protein